MLQFIYTANVEGNLETITSKNKFQMINPVDVLINCNLSIHGLFQQIILVMNVTWFALPLVTIVMNDHVDISGEIKSLGLQVFAKANFIKSFGFVVINISSGVLVWLIFRARYYVPLM